MWNDTNFNFKLNEGKTNVDVNEFYNNLKKMGMEYGPKMRLIQEAQIFKDDQLESRNTSEPQFNKHP